MYKVCLSVCPLTGAGARGGDLQGAGRGAQVAPRVRGAARWEGGGRESRSMQGDGAFARGDGAGADLREGRAALLRCTDRRIKLEHGLVPAEGIAGAAEDGGKRLGELLGQQATHDLEQRGLRKPPVGPQHTVRTARPRLVRTPCVQ
jgi:hypothetical protein